jgi:endonuclease YncB( thermonuclease family)
MTVEHRAVCVNVVDGDTWDLLVDRGFHDYKLSRFRLAGYDAYELRRGTPEDKEKGRDAKEMAIEWLQPLGVKHVFDISHWPLRIRTQKDPGNFGRWLADVWFIGDDGEELHLGDELVKAGVAVKLTKKKRKKKSS